MKNKKIKLAIDASRSIDSFQKTGVELVSDELLKEIHKQDSEVVFYSPKKIAWLPKDIQKILKWFPIYLWTQIRLAIELLVNQPEKIFAPVHKIPLLVYLLPNKIEKYILIHDIAFKKKPELYSSFKKWYLSFDLKLLLQKCKKVFVPTQAVKDDLLKYTNVKNNKVIVINHGYSPQKHLSTEALKHKKKQILYIGRVEEKKNIRNLIKGFKIFLEKNLDYKLILAGKVSTALSKQLTELRNGFEDKIKILGYVREEKKQQLFAESECLVLVSKEEGFGFPVLEAWDYNLPVLISNISVLKEIGGEACLYCDLESVEDIAEKLNKIIQNRELRKKLIKKGNERIKKFSWELTVERYLDEIL